MKKKIDNKKQEQIIVSSRNDERKTNNKKELAKEDHASTEKNKDGASSIIESILGFFGAAKQSKSSELSELKRKEKSIEKNVVDLGAEVKTVKFNKPTEKNAAKENQIIDERAELIIKESNYESTISNLQSKGVKE